MIPRGFNLTDRTLTVTIDGVPYSIDRQHASFDAALATLSDPSATDADILALVSPSKFVENAVATYRDLAVTDGVLVYRDEVVDGSLAKRIVSMAYDGFDVRGMMRFADNLFANPAGEWVRNELYDWMNGCDLPITGDGKFLAYKVVNGDYTDCYTGTFNNTPGVTVQLEGRDKVDPNRDRTCSHGLHFAAPSYIPKYGGNDSRNRIVVVEVNPYDVVSIPSDYDFAKGRTWRYRVVGEVTPEALGMTWPMVSAVEPTFEAPGALMPDDVEVAPIDPTPVLVHQDRFLARFRQRFSRRR